MYKPRSGKCNSGEKKGEWVEWPHKKKKQRQGIESEGGEVLPRFSNGTIPLVVLMIE